ncbi:MAG: Re/Si-specific NAD(P)(+) transhydrogenase subunit alpha [Planctomycetota bacterium]|nr:MAG: Re/Si-specific NAD(P)(+) transhydrogenase subunit alpha [Planctomycetota bacterium]
MTSVFIPKETLPGETRVAATPETITKMVKLGLQVFVEADAGAQSFLSDADYQAAGAQTVASAAEGYSQANLVLKVAAPTLPELEVMPKGQVVVSFLSPARNLDLIRKLVERGITSFAMDLVPRITKAQKMDALSSQANIAGYKAVLLGASALGRYFPLLMTAAGTVKPARVVVFGAGVAGLQAIATARRLGAVVEATDIRPAVKEQVESLGAKFIDVAPDEGAEDEGGYAREASEDYKRRQAEAVAEHVSHADVVITTAQVPGKKAPMLLPESMLKRMRPGSVIVDLAADQGGNCAWTEAGKTVQKEGLILVGETNLPATVPSHASQLYARNVLQVVQHLVVEGDLKLDFEEEITTGSIAVHQGEIRHAPTAEALQAGALS